MGGPALEVGPPVSGSGDPPHNGAGAVGRSFRGVGRCGAVSQTGVVGPVLWGGLPTAPQHRPQVSQPKWEGKTRAVNRTLVSNGFAVRIPHGDWRFWRPAVGSGERVGRPAHNG